MKVAFISLGCAKNLVNTEQMMALTRDAGYELVSDPEGADVAVLNTCGFIDSAKSEAIQNILELAALKDAGKLGKLLVAGCLSQRYQSELEQEMPEVDGVLGTGSYTDIVSALEEVTAGGHPRRFGDIDHTEEDGARVVSTPPYTAYLKIAEGCDNRCSYCIIPYLRGRYRSRSMESLLAEAKALADRGVQELIVIAQDITRYGTDLYGRRRLGDLLTELCRLPFHWVRLHYLYPDEVDDDLIDVLAREHKILKYIDIPLQHINDGILKAMNRRSTKAEIIALLHKLRQRLPGLVLRTSLICGLPGEGEAEFEELCQFLQEAGIERAGIFQFSPEEGTPAAVMEHQVEPEVAARRVELLVELQSRVMDAYNESRLGETLEVLCEGFDPDMGCYAGRSYADSPDVDGRVFFTAAGLVPAGTFVNVRITGTSDGDLTGEIEE
ncbi:MAG TPA: 30S ribosomal protein S12 methylthiotransferase RimO [Candidatus Flavonifractor avistercoris]|nr:30S ribosomal protein S12 methylthiotransferase RimO [Candidatus Flavonifractor avistercoris]